MLRVGSWQGDTSTRTSLPFVQGRTKGELGGGGGGNQYSVEHAGPVYLFLIYLLPPWLLVKLAWPGPCSAHASPLVGFEEELRCPTHHSTQGRGGQCLAEPGAGSR